MRNFFKNKRILHAVIWILIYLFIVSIGDSLNQELKVSVITPILLIIMAVILGVYIKIDKSVTLIHNDKTKKRSSLAYLLMYIPLFLLAIIQFIFGIDTNLGTDTVIMIILSMIGVGFIEELLFRGFLLTSIKQKSNQSRAIIISGITFGLGHIINLTRGYDYGTLISQIILAIIIGLILGMLYVYTKTLIPGILFHILFNISGSISNQTQSQSLLLLGLMLLIAIPYGIYMYLNLKKELSLENQLNIKEENPRGINI